jgi:hypothetical protein
MLMNVDDARPPALRGRVGETTSRGQRRGRSGDVRQKPPPTYLPCRVICHLSLARP